MRKKKIRLIHLIIGSLSHSKQHTQEATPLGIQWFKDTIRLSRTYNSIISQMGSLGAIIIIFSIFIISFSCRDNPTPPPPDYTTGIFLSSEDASCTEAWLKLMLAMSNELRAESILVKRNNGTIFNFNYQIQAFSLPLDTLIVDENLQPKHTYTYKAYRVVNSALIDSSAPVILTTMDTTSHNFTWQIDTLGDGISGDLYDVAIINDTLAFAVGEIYKKDSLGSFETDYYGIAKWNGMEWKLSKILSQPGPFGYRSLLGPKGIFAFSEKEVWLADGGVHRYDGVSITHSYWINGFPGNPNPVLGDGQHIQKLWGTSGNNLYAVGSGGAIAHYNGSTWRRIESGTTSDIQDIWGSKNLKTGEYEILAVASNKFSGGEKKVLKIDKHHATAISDSGLLWSLSGVWFENNRNYYIVGGRNVY